MVGDAALPAGHPHFEACMVLIEGSFDGFAEAVWPYYAARIGGCPAVASRAAHLHRRLGGATSHGKTVSDTERWSSGVQGAAHPRIGPGRYPEFLADGTRVPPFLGPDHGPAGRNAPWIRQLRAFRWHRVQALIADRPKRLVEGRAIGGLDASTMEAETQARCATSFPVGTAGRRVDRGMLERLAQEKRPDPVIDAIPV